MDNKDYLSVVKSFIEETGRHLDILNRGLVKCYKSRQDGQRPLLTGINPSFKEKDGVILGIENIDISKSTDGYWAKKARQFGDMWCQISYMDLFPIRETHQHNGFENSFREEASLRRDLLEITQSEIESMKPKLIIHANKDSIYYWGIKKNSPIGEDANDYENPWMGYKVKRVTEKNYPDLPPCMQINNRLELFPFYRIEGFLKSEKRINQEQYPECSSLKGSFLMEYVMDGRNKKYSGKLYQEKKDGPKEWTEIWEWVKQH